MEAGDDFSTAAVAARDKLPRNNYAFVSIDAESLLISVSKLDRRRPLLGPHNGFGTDFVVFIHAPGMKRIIQVCLRKYIK